MISDTITCPVCKKDFEKTTIAQKYCSSKCSYKQWKENRKAKYHESIRDIKFDKECIFCKNKFTSRYKESRFCSQNCQDLFTAEEKSKKWAKRVERAKKGLFNA